MQDSNLTDTLLGSHITCFLLEEVTQNLLVLRAGTKALAVLLGTHNSQAANSECWEGVQAGKWMPWVARCRIPRDGAGRSSSRRS